MASDNATAAIKAYQAAKTTLIKKYETDFLEMLGNERVARGLPRLRGDVTKERILKKLNKLETEQAKLREQLTKFE